jgi:hypothetical protein
MSASCNLLRELEYKGEDWVNHLLQPTDCFPNTELAVEDLHLNKK